MTDRGAENAKNPGHDGLAEALSDSGQDTAGWRDRQRQQLRGLRRSVPATEREQLDAAIVRNLAAQLADRDTRCIAVYWPLPGEPDLKAWYEEARQAGVRLALPEVVGTDQPLIFRRWDLGAPLGLDALKIPCPAGAEVVTPDTIVAPCLGFDADRFRLGNGGGYYDRTLGNLPRRPCTIGVAYQRLLLPSIRPQPHDVPMDMVVTEKMVFSGMPDADR